MSAFKKGTVDPTWTPIVGDDVDPPWLAWARKEIGQKEKVGSAENPRIVWYHSHAKNKYKTENIAWCASFVCSALEETGFQSNDSEWAQSYANFGKKLAQPKHGCIVVFRWNADSGHVGFYDAKSNGLLPILGGNESDQVMVKDFGSVKSSVIAYRWPVDKK